MYSMIENVMMAMIVQAIKITCLKFKLIPFFNSSENIPVKNSKLLLGKWKRVFFVELDPMRERELILTFINGQN